MSIGGPENLLIAELLSNPRAFTKRPGGGNGIPLGNHGCDYLGDNEAGSEKKSKIEKKEEAMKKPTGEG